MLCAKEGWNWPTGSEEEDFLICQCIFTISKLSPLGKGWGPSFEQTWLHLTKEWAKFGWNCPSGFGEEDF